MYLRVINGGDKNEKMVAYYNAIHPWEGQNLYGSIMIRKGASIRKEIYNEYSL